MNTEFLGFRKINSSLKNDLILTGSTIVDGVTKTILNNVIYLADDDLNIENGTAAGSLQQVAIEQENYTTPGGIASGVGAVALTGQRGDKDPATLDPNEDRISEASGLQAFVAGPGNLAAGDWDFVTGKDNTVYSNRAFVSGGANVSQAVDSEGNLIEEKTNVGRFNAIFGNNNTFKSSNTLKESNLIAGGSNTVDTERSIIVGYNNNVSGYYDAIFGLGNVVNASYSLTGGGGNTINGAYHLVAGSNNEISGQFNIASGQDNNNAGWNSAVIGKGLIIGEGYTSQTILGQYNDNKSNTVLEIGWGDPNNRKNIFEVYKDGVVKTEKGTLSTESYVQSYVGNTINNLTKLEIGSGNDDSSAVRAITVGLNNKNKGWQSAAIGNEAYVGYNKDGSQTTLTPTGAVALNWSRANANYCLSACYDTEVIHDYSVALNNKTKTGTSAQTVIGSYNAAKDNTAFEVGNGSASDRKNAFEVLKDGRAKVQSAPIDNDDVVRLADINKAVEEKIAEASVKNAVKITKYLNQGGSYNQTLEVAPSEELPGNVSLYQNDVEIAVDGPTTKNSFEFKLLPNQKALLEDNLTLQSIKFKDTLTAAQFNSPAIKNNGLISLSFNFEDRPSPTYLPITVVVSNDGSLAIQGSAWYYINTENFELTINFDNYISIANSRSDEQYILNGYLIVPLTLANREFTLSYSNGNISLSKYITEEYKTVTKPIYKSDCSNLTITSPTGVSAYLQTGGNSNIASTTFEPITYDITSNAKATLEYEGLPLNLLD